ncbi:MAG: YdjY domain-containing protein [Planctomycetia bacterium]|nr:YdjY domain-containing protein [Planctomycetia bacterium]
MKPIRTKKIAGWLAVLLLVLPAAVGCQKAARQPTGSGETSPSAKQSAARVSEPAVAAAAKSATSEAPTAADKPAVVDAGPSRVPSDASEKSETPLTNPSPQATGQTTENASPKQATPSKPEATASEVEDEEEMEAKPRDLGPPLVDDPKSLVQLDPTMPGWIDRAHRQVVMVGEVCQRTAPLEMFACLRNTKEHEAVVSVPTKAANIHAALLAVGAEAGHPVQFLPKYVPVAGTEIEITVRWKDPQGKVQTARAQDWVRDYDTKKPMEHPWVFGGSGFWTDERTGERHYQAQSGDFICVANFPSAMLDLPIPSTDKDGSLLYEAFTERIPPLGTPVTLILTPKLDKKPKAEGKDADGTKK